MEGVEWIWENGILKPQQIEKYETEIREASSAELASVQEKVFKDFLSKL
jgi:predicted DNA-binding antitoxin AbrB/MazE fold protein